MKNFLLKGYAIHAQFEQLEKKFQQHDKILHEHDQKFDLIINTGLKPAEGIFFDGQIFDAWQFASGLIKDANRSIILIDNYIDETVLALFAKRKEGVSARIFTGKITKQLETDLLKHNAQYPAIEVKTFTHSHDRFLIIDEKTVYHIGASLKDLGKKPVVSGAEPWFAFSKINLDIQVLLNRLESLNEPQD